LRIANVAENGFILELVYVVTAAGIVTTDMDLDEHARCGDVRAQQYKKTLLSGHAVQVIDIVA